MKYYQKSRDTPAEEIGGGVFRRVNHLEKLMMAVIDFTGGPMKQADPFHSHPHEQISYVSEGRLEVFIGKEMSVLEKGDTFRVPSSVPHTVRTLTEHVRLVDSFSPVREEFIK